MIKKIISHKSHIKRINYINVFGVLMLLISTVLSGCFYSSSAAEEEINERNAAAEEEFEKEYEAAKKKYEKYYDKVVSGQEVLDLIDNWDETYYMTVEDLEGERFSVNDIDKDNTIFKYWDKDSIYYIDPNAFYEGSFILFEPPGRVYHISIGELYFSLVEDPSLSEDKTTENDD